MPMDSKQNRAQAKFASFSLPLQMDFQSEWSVLEAKVEDMILFENVRLRKVAKRRKPTLSVYNVHHVVSFLRQVFYTYLLQGLSPSECSKRTMDHLKLAT